VAPVRRSRPARRAQQPQTGTADEEPEHENGPAAAQDAAPARKSPARRTARKRPARTSQPTSAMTSSDTSKFA
jgi:hypothetical protein